MRLDDLTGYKPVLLIRSGARDASALQSVQTTADALGVTVVSLATAGDTTSEDPTDIDGTYDTWLTDLDSSAVLTRPDFYVLDTATTAEDVPGLLDSFRRLARQTPQPASV